MLRRTLVEEERQDKILQAARIQPPTPSEETLLSHDELVSRLLETGCYERAAQESLARLRETPDDLQAAEHLLKARWKSGDVRRTLLSADIALRLNPHEPGYRYLRGHLFQSVAMFKRAMEEFEAAASLGAGASRERAVAALRALEDWQISLVHTLLEEDRSFRLDFAVDAERALDKRGFALGKKAHDALIVLAANAASSESLQIGFS